MRCFGNQLARRAAGLALLAGAVGCGGRVAGEEADSEAPRAPPPYATAPPQRATPPSVSAPPAPRAPQDPPQPMRPQQPPDNYDPPDAYAENVLAANCGNCHGPALTPAQASARINYIDDIDRLVEVGLIVPLNSAASRLVQVMLDGSMPPVASGYPPMTPADIATVADYIDNPRFWPDFSPPPVSDVDAGVPAPAVDAGADGGGAD